MDIDKLTSQTLFKTALTCTQAHLRIYCTKMDAAISHDSAKPNNTLGQAQI